MNTCVGDDQVIINIQGIRNISWGEATSITFANPGKKWFLTVTYKGSHSTFYYRTESEAHSLFNKLTDAMVKK